MELKLEPKTPMSSILAEVAKSKVDHYAVSSEQTNAGLERDNNNLQHLVHKNKQEENPSPQTIPEVSQEFLRVGVVWDSEDEDQGLQSLHEHTVPEILCTPEHWNSKLGDVMVIDSVKESLNQLATALALNEGLKFLDISNNGLSEADVDKLFSAWAAASRWVHQPKRLVIDNRIVQFSADNEQHCGLKHCCGIS